MTRDRHLGLRSLPLSRVPGSCGTVLSSHRTFPTHVQAVRLTPGGEMPTPIPHPSEMTVHLLWINAGLSCDGDSVSLTNATLPSVEDIVMGGIPGLPKVVVHWPLVDYQVGDDFMQWFWKAAAGEIDPFVLVVEGSIPNESVKDEGYWAAFGNSSPGASRFSDEPMKTTEWL